MASRQSEDHGMSRSPAMLRAIGPMCSLSKSGRIAILASASSYAWMRIRRLPMPMTSFSPPGHFTISEWHSAQLWTRKGTCVLGSSVRCIPMGNPSRASRSLLCGSAARGVNPKRSANAPGVAAEHVGVHR